jgi:hypothetical protein
MEMREATLAWGSADLPDDAFVAAFEDGRYPHDRFRHADHVRLAWIYARRHGAEEAAHRMRRGIRAFARQAGVPGKYHETITMAWVRLVAAALALSPGIDDFARFVRAHAWLLEKDALLAFYSRERLMGEAARGAWVEPDLRPLPALAPAAFPDPE